MTEADQMFWLGAFIFGFLGVAIGPGLRDWMEDRATLNKMLREYKERTSPALKDTE